jgi:hypothetical protein
MKFELDTYNRNTADQDLLDDLRRVAKELGKDMVANYEYKENGKYGVTTFIRRFGSWNKAIENAGLKPIKTANHSDEDFYQDIETVWIKLGRQPRWSEMEKPLSRFSGGSYQKRFGGWRLALENFVKFINSQEIDTEQTLQIKTDTIAKHKTKRDINWRLRFLVMRRDNFKCVACGRNPATNAEIVLHVDHKKAWDKGGETVFENLQTLCSVCNIGKSNLEFQTDDAGSL